MSLAFEEQLSIGRKLSDAEYKKYVEAFHKEYNAQPAALRAGKNVSPDKKTSNLTPGEGPDFS